MTTTTTIAEAHGLVTILVPELADSLTVVRHDNNLGPQPNVVAYAVADFHPRLRPPAIVFCGDVTIETTLHEAAHLVPANPDRVDSDHSPEVVAVLVHALERWIADPSPRTPWDGDHGPRWLRMLIHLWFRASECGVPAAYGKLGACDGLRHDLADYASFLRWECRKFVRSPFHAIQDTPAPEGFLELFHRDQATWLAAHSPTEGVTTI